MSIYIYIYIYCIVCGKYKKFKNPKISYIFDETWIVFIIFSKCVTETKKIFKEEESTETLRILDSINNLGEYQKNI